VAPELAKAAGAAGLEPTLAQSHAALAKASPDWKAAAVQQVRELLQSPAHEPVVVANLPGDIKERLQALSSEVWLSRETAEKQVKHPEITAESYGWLDELLLKGERIYDRARHVIVIWHQDRPYMAVLKVTKDNQYVFLQSFRRTDAKNVADIKNKNAGGN
jgi:hypothetical protein